MSEPALATTASDTPDDREVVARVLAGERALYTVLVGRYNQRLYRAARSILRADDDARDVVQQAWVLGFHRLAQWRGEAPFAAWITRIAVNEAVARVRQTSLRRELLARHVDGLDEPSAPRDPEADVARGQLAHALERTIDGLPPRYRCVFVLRDVQGLDTAETAASLGISEETVRVRLHRARDVLRRELSERLGAATIDAFRFDGERCARIASAVRVALGL
jgi:RNA polymerase sigma-70 factor, ECF subfamily